MEEGSQIDRMRKALAKCTFLPGSSHKRFARQVAQTHPEKVTEKQVRHIIRLAWRYRRQMPFDLIPSKDAVEALDGAWQEQTVAGVSVMVPGNRFPKKEPKGERQPEPLPLFA